MEVIVQNVSKFPIQKEEIDVDIEKCSILFYQAYQPMHTLHLGGKMYVYVNFSFMVRTDDNQDIWIVPKELNG